MESYDKIVIGAGLYGLYAADRCASRGERILVLEHDSAPFGRATYVNQARVHMGYHYPRSLATAGKSAGYFDRFNEAYGFCVHSSFKKIYATSAALSWTNAEQFQDFSDAAGIRCTSTAPSLYFNEGLCDGAFETEEYTYDALVLRDHFVRLIDRNPNIEVRYGVRIERIENTGDAYAITLADGTRVAAGFVLNATYASVNQLLAKLGFEPFRIKYELCEVIICNPSPALKDLGITVMDGPFFSIMPFGQTGQHSLTSVAFTPHKTSHESLPTFTCQAASNGTCTPAQLGNCNDCVARPASAWDYMSTLARKYLRPELSFSFDRPLYSMKPILATSEVDDSRPTVIRVHSSQPTFVSVLSGKINTLFDLDPILEGSASHADYQG
jgi:glycine/D-amino acid oxidase-like deaminating enzyme